MNDLISRQAAIDSFWELDVEIRPSAINAIIDMIRNLSPAETPKRTGKSAQNVPNDDLISRKAAIEAVEEECPYNYCPICGADMRGGKHENNA